MPEAFSFELEGLSPGCYGAIHVLREGNAKLTDRRSVLARVLGLDPTDLLQKKPGFYDAFDSDLYEEIEIRPKNKEKKSRIVLSPCDNLKKIQRAVLNIILSSVPPHPAATAFYSGRSIGGNAKQHHRCRHLYKTDISDFFNSISAGSVRQVLEQHFPHLSRQAVREIVTLATYKDALPQGAPTSPHLANLVLYHFDDTISRLAEKLGAKYTRYADDIAVSANDEESLTIIARVIQSSLAELGLRQHPAKTKLLGPSSNKIVTGIDISASIIRPPRAFRKRTAALVRMCERYPARMGKAAGKVMGCLAYWKGVSPEDPDLRKLLKRFGSVQHDWSRATAADGVARQQRRGS